MQSLKFTPQTDEEIYNLLPDGEYDGVVVKSEFHVGQTGKHSIKLTISTYNKNGLEKLLFCYLTPNFQKILKHFCRHTDNMDKFDSGSLLPESCDNKNVRMKVIVKDDPKFGSKNEISDFIALSAKSPEKNDVPFFNDEVPF